MKFVEKQKVPTLAAGEAFMCQRGKESGSTRLRNEVQRLLNSGKAHTTTVAKVFELILRDSADRITDTDVRRVLPGYEAVNDNGW